MNKNLKPKFKWDGSAPLSKEKVYKPVLEKSSNKETRDNSPITNSLLEQHINANLNKVKENSTGPLYSVKYLGITKGQIGILSKRSPIPQLSPLETCKDVPLTLINSYASEKRTNSRLANKLINNSNADPLITDFSNDKSEDAHEEENFPDPENYNEFVVHTYARPKALISVRKMFNNEEITRKPVIVPYNRVGISGWKLSRPKTATDEQNFTKRAKSRCYSRKADKEKKVRDIPEFYNEPYLKYLAEKKNALDSKRVL